MSTASADVPTIPLRVVGSRERSPGEQLRLGLEKRRWARFLVAREAVLRRLRSAGAAFSRLADSKGLSGALRLAQRTLGWLVGVGGLARRALSAAGALPAVAWALTTGSGQAIVRTVVRTSAILVRRTASAVMDAATWFLRLFGRRGGQLADRLQQRVERTLGAVTARLTPLAEAGRLVATPSGLVMTGVRTLAQARFLSVMASRVLPRPWSLLARMGVSLLSLPRFVRDEAVRFVRSLLANPQEGVSGPDDDPTPPPAHVVDLEAQRSEREAQREDDELEVLEHALRATRPSSGRSPHAKRKR